MAKVSTHYFCSNCGYESSGYLGRCPSCSAWNSFVEERRATGAKNGGTKTAYQGWLGDLMDEEERRESKAQGGTRKPKAAGESKLMDLDEVSGAQGKRVASGIAELDRVLGGGFVVGSLVLVGGDPGIGKSTLLLQVCATQRFSGAVLYVSGEESPQQIKLRAERLGVSGKGIKLLPEICFERIAVTIVKLRPDLCIIDSIQTLYSEELQAAPGSVSQVRDVTAGLLRLAKALGTTIVLVGHVTKDGSLAGPRVLEHMVDSVLYFEGEQHNSLRILRAVKNRFGATNELGIFEMTQAGLIAVSNASAALLSQRPEQVAGAAVSCCMEGTRPLLVELQALTTPTVYGSAQRALQGVERSRLLMILAVLENKIGLKMGTQDVFVNVVGGLKVQDTATDLALAVALASSMKDRPVKDHLLLLGEIGLTGELRVVSNIDRRITEAHRLGFKTCVVPGASRTAIERLQKSVSADIIYVDNVAEAIDVSLAEK